MGEDDLGDSAPQYSTREGGRSNKLDLEQHSSESTAGNKAECILITHIHATDVDIRLRRIPVGFYVAVESENVTKRTSSKPVSVGKDVVEWNDEIVLPSDRSSKISLTVFTSFELGPTLGNGEVLGKFEITVGELLDHIGQLKVIRLLGQSNGEVNSSRSSLEIEIEQRVYGRGEGAVTSNSPESEEMRRLGELTDRGHGALNRYRELQEQRDLEESMKHFEHARGLCPLDHPSRASVLFNLATAKLIHCRVNDLSPDLDVPIELYRGALRLRPRGHPDHPFTLLSLGVALQARFQRQHNEADGTEGETLLSQVLDVSSADCYGYHAAVLALCSTAKSELIQPTEIGQVMEDDDDDDGRVQRLDTALRWMFYPDSSGDSLLDHLGILFCIRFDCLGDLVNPEKAISVLEVVVRFTSDNHPDKLSWLGDLGGLLLTRYMHFGDVADLERSILMRELVVQFTPDGHTDKPAWLNSLGNSLLTRYERFGDIDDLERSISMFKDAVRITPDGHPYKPAPLLNNLGNSMLNRYQRFGDAADLERSVSMFEEAVLFTSDGHSDKPVQLNNLGISLLTRYKHSGEVVDLEKSISMFEDAVQFTPDDDSDKPPRLNNLGGSLLTRYQRFGETVDLERSISMKEDAVRFTPNGHPDKPARLNNLSNSLFTRYERFGDAADLERLISMKEDVVRFTPDGHPDKPARLNNLGNSLLTRYERFGDAADLGTSISMFEDAVRFTPGGHAEKPAPLLNNLGNSLLTRYERFGDAADLERSISMFQEAVRFTPDGHSDRPSRLNNLGNSLLTRYDRFGDVIDLERSISMRELVVQCAPDNHTDKLEWLDSLGNSLLTRYQRFRDAADLERSISMFEDAVRFTPDGHPDKHLRLNNLGNSLLTRYHRFGDAANLERSISMFEDTVRLTPDGHPDKPAQLNNLGISLLARYEHFGGVVDLEKSILMLEDAVQFTPDGHPDKSSRQNSLALSFLQRVQRSGNFSSSDLPRAILYSSHAARSQTGSSPDRFQACQLWIQCLRLLRHDSQSLLDPYSVAVNLLPQLAWIGLSLHDRYHQLLRAADETCDAAAAALDAHRPELAVEWLEQGRSIVWSQLSQLRTPINDLRAVYPELAAQFERISHELEHTSARDRAAVTKSTNNSNMMGGLMEKQAQQHHTLALERARLLAEIRALPGFERFLLPKTIDQLSSLAHSGPVVFLNASKHRCDALVVMAGSAHVVHVPLSNTSYDEVAGMQLQLNKLLRLHGRVILRDDADRGARPRGMSVDDVFRSILSSLWDKVVSPILEVLVFSTSGPKHRHIFWCPTGPFTFLPVHAAGIYDTANLGPKLSDLVISSYIPTMSALELSPQQDSEATSCDIRFLAVPQPSTDGQVHLTGVEREMEVVREVTSLSPFVGFEEADGTVEDVLAKMTETDWVHFACHGTQDRTNPLDSGLLLADCRRLKVSDIVRLPRPHGGLAFLSACNTATGDERLSEEAIHIAAGMLLAGYRGVIATMWTIMDSDAPRVTEDVYKSLFRDGKVPDSRQAAEALHDAIERLRDSGVSFLSWVPFIHVGL